MSRTGQLYDLQQIDGGLDSRVARMRQIDEQVAGSPKVVEAKAAHDQAAARLVDGQAALKRASHEAEATSTRLKTQEKRLYGGSIKNPKELSQVQEEATHLRQRLRAQEDAVIEAMLAVEEAESVDKSRRAALDGATGEWEQFQAGLMEEKDKLLSQAKVLQVKRQRVVAELPWADLQTYERLRRGKGGVAVAGVRGGLCGGCHVAVPANILRHARAAAATELVMCPSCGRILYPLDEIRFKEFDHDLDNVDR